jgi:peptidoglycan/LPS O-acetylase OafA/YrhL
MFAHYLALSWGVLGFLPVARAAVTVFFLISGYVLTLSWDGGLAIFLVRRFLRLWPVFALCMGFGALVLKASPLWSEYFWYPMASAKSNFSFDVPMWSMFVEAWAMLAMPLIVWGGKTPSRVAAALAIFVGMSYFMPNALYGAFFVLGSYCTKFSFDLRFLNTRIPQWLGKISYSLYLTHWIVLIVCNLYIPTVAMAVQLPLCLLVAQIVWMTIENPSVLLSREVAKRLGAGQSALESALHRRVPT